MKCRWLTFATCALVALFSVTPAPAAVPVPSKDTVTAYPQSHTLPTGGAGPLVVGPGGNVWFTEVYEESASGPGEEPHYPPRIVRMSPLGQIEIVAERVSAESFAVTPDGSVWFTGSPRRIGAVRPGGWTESFLLPETETESTYSGRGPNGTIVAGADGNVWFSASRSPLAGVQGETSAAIGRITPGGEVTLFDLPGGGGDPTRLALGPDGNVWFTERGDDRVGRISPAGEIVSFLLPPNSRPGNIVAGPDGALWFNEDSNRLGARIGRLTTGGEFREFSLGAEPNETAGALAVGSDGRLWFTLEAGAIHRMTPQGRISRVQLPNPTGVTQIVAGPEGNIWYSAMAEPPCAPGDSGCGDAGYFQAGIIGRVEPAPLTVAIDGARPARRGRFVKLRLSCLDGRAESSCRGKLRLRAAGTVSRRSFRLGTDLARGFRLRLGRQAQAKLLRTRRLRIACTTVLAGGGITARTLVVRLTRPS